ncbi:MAG: molybdopterin-dependent oxidoreductase [Microbacteriaceae bacterium]
MASAASRRSVLGRSVLGWSVLGWAALVGIVAAACTLAAAELTSVLISPQASPVFAVGRWIIDLAPAGAKEFAIAVFGAADKAVLLIALALLVTIVAALTGVLEWLARGWGIVVLVAVSTIAVLAVTTRAHADGFSAVPTVLGMLLGALVLYRGIRRLRAWRDASERGTASAPPVARRSFLRLLLLSGAAAVVIGVGARVANAGAVAVTALRERIRLPRPATAAAAVPAAATLTVPGLSTFVTDSVDFYRIDTALQIPTVDPDQWSLTIDGMVQETVSVSFAELLRLPLTERLITLSCVSNEVGGDLIGNARWLGYPIRSLLERAKPKPGADMVLSHSADGWTAGTPLEVLQDRNRSAILAVGMNGEPLPFAHGFPVRMVVPGLYGYVSATKWVVRLELTSFAKQSAYWTTQGWAPRGPVKTESRIDTPREGQRLDVGRVAIAGVAWAPHTGIRSVEVQVDAGAWQPARLAEPVSADTWRQWMLPWEATRGRHTLSVRATDLSGYTQTAREASPVPDGATGWHRVQVNVG